MIWPPHTSTFRRCTQTGPKPERHRGWASPALECVLVSRAPQIPPASRIGWLRQTIAQSCPPLLQRCALCRQRNPFVLSLTVSMSIAGSPWAEFRGGGMGGERSEGGAEGVLDPPPHSPQEMLSC